MMDEKDTILDSDPEYQKWLDENLAKTREFMETEDEKENLVQFYSVWETK